MENNKKGFVEGGKTLNLKATELRLGLPGSESPDRVGSSGAKRGFLDTINNTNKWDFTQNAGSDTSIGLLFSPRGSKLVSGSDSGLTGPVMKESGVALNVPVAQSPKQVAAQEKKASDGVAPNKAQVVGWPPIRSFRKNSMASQPPKNEEDEEETKQGFGCLYVKVSMDGAPYLRKVDLKTYGSYMELSSALEKMFGCFTIGQFGSHGASSRDGLNESRLVDLLHGSEYVLTYEDKDGDWMLVGDVPWKMFTNSCKRLRIMKSSEAIGLAPRAMEKCKNRA